MAMSKTTLYLPAELRDALREAAQRTGRPEADLVRRALEVYLREEARPLPSSIGIVDDPAFRGRDDEAWLEAEWGRS